MAQSRLDPDVVYPVHRDLEPEDREFDAWVYETSIGGHSKTVAVGQPRTTFQEQGIVHYPVYLVRDGTVDGQIGVYEVRDELVPHVLDEEGAVQPDLMGEPLLYPAPESANETRSPVAQTKEEDAKIRKAYRTKRGAPWIQKFMRNPAYGLVDNEAGGDCLFAAVRQGLEYVGIVKSVADLRKILADSATQALFEGYEAQYIAAKAQHDSAAAVVKSLTQESRGLRSKMRGTTREAQFALIEKAEVVTAKLAEEKAERDGASELLEEFAFMKGITSLPALKAVLQTSAYWGDTWAVSTLEHALNVKFVIFSKDAFMDRDEGNVLQCGQNNDADPEEFSPEYYLLLSLGGEGTAGSMHYELISYDDRRAFTYSQLPYRVRHLVITKCLERSAGPYYVIPEFREALGQVVPDSPQGRDVGRSGAVFQVYGKSSGRPRPGRGAGESAPSGDEASFTKLAGVSDWRRLLADDAPSARELKKSGCAQCFDLDGKKWATVRHYVLSQRYREKHPDFADQFAYTGAPDNKLGIDVEMAERVAAARARKRGDPEGPAPAVLTEAQELSAAHRARVAKFAVGTEARRALMATGSATINVYKRGAPAVPASGLMELRDKLGMSPEIKT